MVEADESDLTLLSTQAANAILKKTRQVKTGGMNKLDLGKLKVQLTTQKSGVKTNRQEIIDGLLDIYNDYQLLFDTF